MSIAVNLIKTEVKCLRQKISIYSIEKNLMSLFSPGKVQRYDFVKEFKFKTLMLKFPLEAFLLEDCHS